MIKGPPGATLIARKNLTFVPERATGSPEDFEIAFFRDSSGPLIFIVRSDQFGNERLETPPHEMLMEIKLRTFDEFFKSVPVEG